MIQLLKISETTQFVNNQQTIASKCSFLPAPQPLVLGVLRDFSQLQSFRRIRIKQLPEKLLASWRHRLEILWHFARSFSTPTENKFRTKFVCNWFRLTHEMPFNFINNWSSCFQSKLHLFVCSAHIICVQFGKICVPKICYLFIKEFEMRYKTRNFWGYKFRKKLRTKLRYKW